MGAEVLLYGYGLVCLSMLAFNVLYALHLRSGDRRLGRRRDSLRREVCEQLERLRADVRQPVEAKHLASMRHKLARVSVLLAFDRLLDELDDGGEAFEEYLRGLQPVLLYLSTVYYRREDTQAAYYCHFLARHRLRRDASLDQLQNVLLSYFGKNSLYCRLNALKALCSFGSAPVISGALEKLGGEMHPKMITEALMSYTGDAKELMDLLLARLRRFDLAVQRAILDYIRFKSGAYADKMEAILRDGSRDRELRFAAIRYFGKYPDERVRDALLEFVRSRDTVEWEYAAISATALAGYPGQDVTDALLEAMHSPNWYVRFNASSSLERHGLSYEAMLDILSGGDRYAREMLNYRLESRRLSERAKTEGTVAAV